MSGINPNQIKTARKAQKPEWPAELEESTDELIDYCKAVRLRALRGFDVPSNERRELKAVIKRLSKLGAISRDKAVEFEAFCVEDQDYAWVGEATDIGMLYGLLRGYGTSDEWGHHTHYWIAGHKDPA